MIKEDLTDKKFNHWTVIKELGGGKVLCECDCENHTVRELYKKSVKDGTTKSCGCAFIRKRTESIEGHQFGNWTVLKDLGKGKVLCQCQCENKTTRELYKKAVVNGQTKSCGCMSGRRSIGNIEGEQFGNWVVLKELGHGKVLCQCQCEAKTTRELYKKAVVNGQTKSCGCLRSKHCNETKAETGSSNSKYIGEHFGEWEVLGRVTNSAKLKCRCSCGTIREIYVSHLLNGESKSCGCKIKEHSRETMLSKFNDISALHSDKPREQWQLDAIKSRDSLLNFIKSYDHKVTFKELREDLDISQSHMSRLINTFKLNDNVQYLSGESIMENELCKYISTIYNGTIERHNSKILNNEFELDIYLPDKNIAIEFNGNYWHSIINKYKDYHQLKTIQCRQYDIRLIHIFEYEWENSNEVIKSYLKDILQGTKKLYARNFEIQEVNKLDAMNFLKSNHLQGYAQSSINIALTMNNEIFAIMTFDRPRFNSQYQFELIRMAFKNGISIIGGAERLFKHFLNKYNPENVVSYCDISKFSGNTYMKLGFDDIKLTEPNYVWYKIHTNDILTRYQTQKQNLIKKGLGTEGQTEDEIMESIGYAKIYNSGNLRFVWKRKETV